MAYSSWSVVFGEQPSAAKWNILGTNDASFNDGTGIANIEIGSGHTAVKNDYKFSVYRNSALSSGSGADALVPFDTKRFDTGTNVDVITNKGRFTAPVTGFYFLSTSVGTAGGGSTLITLTWYKNGSAALVGAQVTAAGFRDSMSELFSLTAGDYMEVFSNGGGTAISVGSTNNSFSGFLVSAT